MKVKFHRKRKISMALINTIKIINNRAYYVVDIVLSAFMYMK